MSKLDVQDYYFGAALSYFFSTNTDAKPSLIESDAATRIYRMTTDTSEDFYIHMKYSKKEQIPIRDNGCSWKFSLTELDKKKINEDFDVQTYIILICSHEDLKNGEIAVLTQKEARYLSQRNSFTIKIPYKNSKHFVLSDRNSDFQLTIKRNRFDFKFSNIDDEMRMCAKDLLRKNIRKVKSK